LVFLSPITTGEDGTETPVREFRILAVDSHHISSFYFVEHSVVNQEWYMTGVWDGWLSFFWALIILGIVYLINLTAGSRRKKPFEESPLDILKRRYANGELV
jgi:uncharacterized membrane protein